MNKVLDIELATFVFCNIYDNSSTTISGCIDWSGPHMGSYPVFYVSRYGKVSAVRFSYSYFNNCPLENIRWVHHHCMNSSCVNKDHLYEDNFLKGSFESRLLSTLKNSKKVGDCLEWVGIKVYGYGYIWKDGLRVMAARVIWELFRDKIPDGMIVRRVCGNKLCVNVDHLKLENKIHHSEVEGKEHG